MTDKVMGVTNEAVLSATGSGWSEWFAMLDDAGAQAWDHKKMVEFVAAQGLDKPWWQQMVTSSYERERGLKKVGETNDVGFQIGVQRTVPAQKDDLWRLLFSAEGLATWLGEVERFDLKPGATYRTAAGVSGEIRTLKKGERIRLTWHPLTLDKPTVLQVTVSCPRNTAKKTTLRFHQEKLTSQAHREQMRLHWKDAAAKIESLLI
jgi:uncharacterized protein YndB with AHSA1/START domain